MVRANTTVAFELRAVRTDGAALPLPLLRDAADRGLRVSTSLRRWTTTVYAASGTEAVVRVVAERFMPTSRCDNLLLQWGAAIRGVTFAATRCLRGCAASSGTRWAARGACDLTPA